MNDTIEPLWGVAELARLLNFTTKTIYDMHAEGNRLPPCVPLSSRRLRWRPETVRQWLADLEAQAVGQEVRHAG